MKRCLLLLLSMLLLLFVLPHTGSRARSFDGTERVAPRKACRYTYTTQRRPCRGKCLQHQTHRTPQNADSSATACSMPLYAVIATQDQHVRFPLPGLPPAPVTKARKHLFPELPSEPNPPRFS